MAFCDIQNKCLFFLTALKHSLVILALMNCPKSSLPLPMTFFNKTELEKFPEHVKMFSVLSVPSLSPLHKHLPLVPCSLPEKCSPEF